MSHWKKLKKAEINSRVFDALSQNVNFSEESMLGVPASHLDSRVFYQDAPFLKDAPFLSTLIHNPNHIGCHTRGTSESFFKGTQQIERELIAICAEDILSGEKGQSDGYVASGGTEANMQAIWIYRNYFEQEHRAAPKQICILCSEDSHYSMAKASNVLGVDLAVAKVNPDNRKIDSEGIQQLIAKKKAEGTTSFIVVANMMTTMFGSVDDIDVYTDALIAAQMPFKVHVDGAYGGFIYPFTNPSHRLDFRNPHINSVTLDAHKMVQAPYGTGVFIIRKNWMQYGNTKDATYVQGEDYTLIGSRSGANALAVWMIMMTYGRYEWEEKMTILLKRADWLVKQLNAIGVVYYRSNASNIVTMRAEHVSAQIAELYGLVPDNHQNPNWYKVVVMEHVTIEKLEPLIEALSN